MRLSFGQRNELCQTSGSCSGTTNRLGVPSAIGWRRPIKSANFSTAFVHFPNCARAIGIQCIVDQLIGVRDGRCRPLAPVRNQVCSNLRAPAFQTIPI